jgi:catechol 2,3-dioxygenase-like lactoylglutathione lyase family enzyme
MTIERMHHVGIVVDDLAAAIAFFAELGLQSEGQWSVEDRAVDRSWGSRASGRTRRCCGRRTATDGSSS